VTVEALFWILF